MIIDFNKNSRSKKFGGAFYKNKIALGIIAFLTLISFLFIDKSLALFFYSVQSSIQDPLLLISRIFSPFLSLVLFPSLFFWIRFILKNERKSRRLQMLSMTTALSLLVGQFLAIILGRSNPSWLFDHGEITMRLFNWNPSFHSFPNLTSCNIGALSGAFGCLYQKRSNQFFVGGCLLAFIPALLTECFLSDALIGASIGFGISLFVFQTMKKETSFS